MTMLGREREMRDMILLASQKVTIPMHPSECENLDSLFKEYTDTCDTHTHTHRQRESSWRALNE